MLSVSHLVPCVIDHSVTALTNVYLIMPIHVFVSKAEDKPRKNAPNGKNEAKQATRKHQNQVRQAKSFTISIMGELVKTCQTIEASNLLINCKY